MLRSFWYHGFSGVAIAAPVDNSITAAAGKAALRQFFR
jgi:hypothetical protein